MDKKLFIVLSLMIVVFCITDSFATSGSWTREVVGPNIYLEGRVYTIEFEPLGTIPPNAIITAISWYWGFNNERSDVGVSLGNSNLDYVDISSQNTGIDYSFFDGGNPDASIFMSFYVPGNGTVVPTMLGKVDRVSVSWETVVPESTLISGPSTVEVGETIELTGTVEYATRYTWSTVGDCSIDGSVDNATATVKGNRNGQCTVSREACDSYNNCVTDTHAVEVTGTLSILLPVYQLLLLQ